MTAWIPIASIVGDTHMPPDAAHVLRTAVEQIAAAEHIAPDNRWRALEYLAADYLAST